MGLLKLTAIVFVIVQLYKYIDNNEISTEIILLCLKILKHFQHVTYPITAPCIVTWPLHLTTKKTDCYLSCAIERHKKFEE